MPGFVVLTWLPILYAGHLVCSCLFKTLMAIHVHVALKQQDCVAIGFFSHIMSFAALLSLFRSSGSLPAIFIMESMMEHVAMELGMDTESLRRKNLYEQGQVWEEKNEACWECIL